MRRSWLTGLGGVLALLAGGCGLLLGFPVRTMLLVVTAVLGGALAVTSGGPAIRHVRLSRRLARISQPGRLADTPVRSVPGVGPMVAGLVRPAVYCGDDLAARLDHGATRSEFAGALLALSSPHPAGVAGAAPPWGSPSQPSGPSGHARPSCRHPTRSSCLRLGA